MRGPKVLVLHFIFSVKRICDLFASQLGMTSIIRKNPVAIGKIYNELQRLVNVWWASSVKYVENEPNLFLLSPLG